MAEELFSSLADLANIDAANIEAAAGPEPLPLGVMALQIGTPELDNRTEDASQGQRFRILFPCTVVEVDKLIRKDLDPTTVVGRNHTESVFVDTSDDNPYGRVMRFLQEIGIEKSGSLAEMIASAEGRVFIATVGHRADKTDPSVKYTKLTKIQSVA